MPDPRDMPLIAWGDALRRARSKRRSRRRILAIGAGAVALVALPLIASTRPILVWNASASAPVGLYLITRPEKLVRGDMVVAWLPEAARDLAAKRHYLPANVPAVKRIIAIEGDRVCVRGSQVRVGARMSVTRLAHDRLGRPLPAWGGCRLLGRGELFLLMERTPASFDSRYFGPVRRSNIIGTARLIWVR